MCNHVKTRGERQMRKARIKAVFGLEIKIMVLFF